jgi:preprotein translocase subunit SecG
MMTVLGIILIIVSVALVVLVVLQEGKGRGLSGAISGGSSDTFLGKSKAATKQKKLAKLTIVAASIFAALVLAMYIVGLSGDNYEYKEPAQDTTVTDVAGEDTTAADDTTAEGEEAASDDVVSE